MTSRTSRHRLAKFITCPRRHYGFRLYEAAMGPASFFLPDDAVIAERMQQGFRAGRQPMHGWVDLGRGARRERRDAAGKVGHVSDETTNRGFWQHYRAVMMARG